MPLSNLEYLRHILDETEYLIGEKEDFSKRQFFRDATIQRAQGDFVLACKFN